MSKPAAPARFLRALYRDPWRKLSALMLAVLVWTLTYNRITGTRDFVLEISQANPLRAEAGRLYVEHDVEERSGSEDETLIGRLIAINDTALKDIRGVRTRIVGTNERLRDFGSRPSAWIDPGDLRQLAQEDGKIKVRVRPETPGQFGWYLPTGDVTVEFTHLVRRNGSEEPIAHLELTYLLMQRVTIDLKPNVKLAGHLAERYAIAEAVTIPESPLVLLPRDRSVLRSNDILEEIVITEASGLRVEQTVNLNKEALGAPIRFVQGNQERRNIRVSVRLEERAREDDFEWREFDDGTRPLKYGFYFAPQTKEIRELTDRIKPVETQAGSEIRVTILYPVGKSWTPATTEKYLEKIKNLAGLVDGHFDLTELLKRDKNGDFSRDPTTQKLQHVLEQSDIFKIEIMSNEANLQALTLDRWPGWFQEPLGEGPIPRFRFEPESLNFKLEKEE